MGIGWWRTGLIELNWRLHRKKGNILDEYAGRLKRRDDRFQDKMRSMGSLCKDLVMLSLGLFSLTKKCLSNLGERQNSKITTKASYVLCFSADLIKEQFTLMFSKYLQEKMFYGHADFRFLLWVLTDSHKIK